MNRLEFLKKLCLASTVSALPKLDLKQYEKIYLHQSFIRGFQFYNGEKLVSELQEGDTLTLVRESDNEFDKYAIAIYFHDKKLGFIPRESNKTLSKLLDANLIKLNCEVIKINTDAKLWEKVHIALYALKEKETASQDYEHLKQVREPRYRTLPAEDEAVCLL